MSSSVRFLMLWNTGMRCLTFLFDFLMLFDVLKELQNVPSGARLRVLATRKSTITIKGSQLPIKSRMLKATNLNRTILLFL
jgi:hypothetical protein